MDATSPRTRSEDWTSSDAKEILLRLVVFFFVLFASHGLTIWLQPMGAHHRYWNLPLSGLVFCRGHARPETMDERDSSVTKL